MTNDTRIKQLKRIGVSPDNVTSYTNGAINPYRSVALAMIERGEEVPNDLVEQINYFDASEVNTETENTSKNSNDEDINVDVGHVVRAGALHLALIPPLIMFLLILMMKSGGNIIESNSPYNRITEFVSSYGLSVPEDKYEETFETIDKQFWNDEMAVVELVDADGNVGTYALAGHYEHYGKGVPGLELTQIFDIRDDGSYVPLEKQVTKGLNGV